MIKSLPSMHKPPGTIPSTTERTHIHVTTNTSVNSAASPLPEALKASLWPGIRHRDFSFEKTRTSLSFFECEANSIHTVFTTENRDSQNTTSPWYTSPGIVDLGSSILLHELSKDMHGGELEQKAQGVGFDS